MAFTAIYYKTSDSSLDILLVNVCVNLDILNIISSKNYVLYLEIEINSYWQLQRYKFIKRILIEQLFLL